MINCFRFFLCIGLSFAIFSLSSFADEAKSAAVKADQAADAATYEEPKLGYFDWLLNFPGDFAAFGKDVWQTSTILPFAVTAASTAGLLKYDYELWHPLSVSYKRGNGSGAFYHLSNLGASMGNGGNQLLALGGGFLVAGIISGNHRPLRTTSQVLEVILTTGTVDQVMKHIFGRQSPDSVTDPNVRTGRWQLFTNPKIYSHHVSAYDAYPSGHVLTAFASVEVVRRNYIEQTWIPYIAYPAVALVGVGMVATSGHWWSDYPISIFMGYYFAKAACRNNSEMRAEEEKDKKTSWEVQPYMPIPGSMGLALSRTF